MAEEQGKQEEKFDFTRDGQALGYISMDQARVMAMRTASETPGAYGAAYREVPLAFEVVEAEDTEDHYVITITFRPQGEFAGRPGREQFFITKEGDVALRQVLALPRLRRTFPVLPAAIGLAAVAAVFVGAVFVPRIFDGGGAEEPIPAPTATAAPVAAALPGPTLTPTAGPTTTPAPPDVAPTATAAPLAAVFPTPVLTAAPVATRAPAPATAPAATRAPVPTATPVPTPTMTLRPTGAPKPAGTINIGLTTMGPYMGHPKLAGSPQISINSAMGITESLAMYNETNGALDAMLAESWSVSSDFKTWTFNLRRGVQFHQGYGEMTAENVVWSHGMVSQSENHPRAQNVRNIWFNENGSMETPDEYTVVLNTGVPFSDVVVNELLAAPSFAMTWITSGGQHDKVGEEEANRNTAATGPWEIDEWRAGEFWRLRAVEGHWRKTPFFAELVLWEIPEEATRVAAFQTGMLDTFAMDLDSLPVVEQVEGASLMRIPNVGQAGLNFYGQYHGTPEPAEAYDPALPWVSASTDLASPEWEQARKVRLALSIAIDRELIVDVLLQGFGHPLVLRDWAGRDEARLPPNMRWDYDPDRARNLLAEAGYPDGFTITLSIGFRDTPAELKACEAIASFWQDIGIDVDVQITPYFATLRPTLIERTYKGATCHFVTFRLAPVHGLGYYRYDSVFNYGTMHPWLEEKIAEAQRATAKDDRERLEMEIARFMFDNVFGQTGLYVYDGIWAVGPKLEPWDDHIKRGDLRQQNGMEWARPRR
tara:strand:- start:1939 stop:4239 length:2301 start_codon:yes stop_codon:yes gene_type:complete